MKTQEMKRFIFTAECKRDFDELFNVWVKALRKEGFEKVMRNWNMKTYNDDILTTADVDIEIETNATIDEVIELMERVDDGHKMIRTIEEVKTPKAWKGLLEE